MKKLRCLLTSLFGLTAALQADSPNIILILTDDQGWSQRSGLMDPENPETGSSYLHTPAMDRIAEEGMRFTGGYSPAPLCTPTRRSALGGGAGYPGKGPGDPREKRRTLLVYRL